MEDLVEHGEMARCTHTMAQTINIACSVLNRTTKFRDSIKIWNRRPTLHKTWISFKLHFREAHDEPQETGEYTGGHHQANLTEAIANRVAELQTPCQESAPAPAPAMPAPDTMLPAIVAQMQQMQQMMAAMQANSTPNAPTDRHRGGRLLPTGPRTGTPSRPLPTWATECCWTHGKCAHASAMCNNRAPGHVDSAIMENKQSGSTYGCT
jgi:hypothetical protein